MAKAGPAVPALRPSPRGEIDATTEWESRMFAPLAYPSTRDGRGFGARVSVFTKMAGGSALSVTVKWPRSLSLSGGASFGCRLSSQWCVTCSWQQKGRPSGRPRVQRTSPFRAGLGEPSFREGACVDAPALAGGRLVRSQPGVGVLQHGAV